MKKIILILLIAGTILLTGCSNNKAQVKLLDSITHKEVHGAVIINGEKLQIQDGTVSLKKGTISISKDGYATKNVEITRSDCIVYLSPLSYLKVNVASHNGTGIENATVQMGDRKEITDKNGNCIISPAAKGNQTIEISKKFFESKKNPIDITQGKNEISTQLLTNNSTVQEYMNSLIFPYDQKNFSFTISIGGTADQQEIDYQFMGKVVNYEVKEIWDKNIHYIFDNNEPFIINSVEEKVEDQEKIKALIYARDVIQRILDFKNEISNLNVLDISDNEILIKENKTFENKNIEETILMQITNRKIYKIIISIASDDIENMNINVQIDIE
jgi:hypothetical protein